MFLLTQGPDVRPALPAARLHIFILEFFVVRFGSRSERLAAHRMREEWALETPSRPELEIWHTYPGRGPTHMGEHFALYHRFAFLPRSASSLAGVG